MSQGQKEAKDAVNLEEFPNIFRLDGKVALVTGGSRGLGLNSASGLLQFGCSKVFITSRDAKACDEACAALNALTSKAPGAVAIAIPADNSKVSEIERLVREVAKHTDHVDILLANAGMGWGEEFDKFPEKGFDRIMNLNVKSVFFTIQK
jgi:NAD(P)-dependent dehydrogenase (short-subunit alcohol dehydrogenase family)